MSNYISDSLYTNSVRLPSGDSPSIQSQTQAMSIVSCFYQKNKLPEDDKKKLKASISLLALDGLCLLGRMFLTTQQYKHANIVYNHLFTEFSYKNVPLVHIFNAATAKFCNNKIIEADLLNDKVIILLKEKGLPVEFEIYASSFNYKVRLKKWDEAKEVLDSTTDQSEKFDTNYYFNAMLTTAHLGDFEKAREYCLKVLLTTKKDEDMYSVICQKMIPEKYEQIKAIYLAELTPTKQQDLLPTMVITAFMCAGAGKIEDASKYFDQALELAKNEKNEKLLESVMKFRAQISMGMTVELLKGLGSK